jgi:hypothetical protein
MCPGASNVEAEKAGVRYSFVNLDDMSWSDRPAPKKKSPTATWPRRCASSLTSCDETRRIAV